MSTSLITRLAKKCGIRNPLSCDKSSIKASRRGAWNKYAELKPNARELRDQWLDKLAEFIANTEGEAKAKVIRMLKSREEVRESHRRIKAVRKKKSVGGTRKLTKVDNCDPNVVVEVTDKQEMEDMLMQANEEKFRGSQGTPLTVEPLKSVLGWTSTTKQAEQILLGDFSCIHTSVSPAVKKFFKKVKLSPEVLSHPAISAEIRPCDFLSTWRKQNEKTQSSWSGLHFGFFKAILKDPKLVSTMSHMSSIPFEAGYAPDR